MRKTCSLFFLISVIGLASAVWPLRAQESHPADCDIDLSGTISLLERAQAAADSGDGASAARLLADARAQLEAMEAQCRGGFLLDASFTLDDPDRGSLTFDYPSAWVTQQDASDNVILASSQEVLEGKDLGQSTPPAFSTGEVLVNVALSDVGFYGVDDQLGDDADVLALAETLAEDIKELGQPSPPTRLSVADRRAARLDLSTDDFGLLFILVDLGQGKEGKQFGHIILLTAPGDLAALERLALDIAATFKFRP